jgi:hypothetical protein
VEPACALLLLLCCHVKPAPVVQRWAERERSYASHWSREERVPKCQGCAGGALVPRRLAASCAARAAYLLAREKQLHEDLRATREGCRARVVALARFEVDEGPVAAVRALPPGDLCSACHHELEQVSGVWQAQCDRLEAWGG